VPDVAAPKPLAEPKSFVGELSLDHDASAVSFRVGIDANGEIELEFDPISLNNQTKFILLGWDRDRSQITYFSLKGVAEDGTRFETSHLSFTSLGKYSDASGTRMTPDGSCSKAVITYKLMKPAEKPALRVRVKGFKTFGSHHAECVLGKVGISGQYEFDDPNTVTGSIAIEAATPPEDVAAWHAEADRLVEHIRRIMSLASATMLQAPIFEFFDGDTLAVTAWSQTKSSTSAFPIFHFLDHDPIFKAAIKSFFDPPFPVNRLFFAIEWFAMDASYNEVRLVAAMTALENLIDSNVKEAEELILPKREFEKIRRILLKIIRACVAKWASGGEDAMTELNEKLVELNRRSLLRKLKLLADRWNVPLDGISTESLRAAKQARDRVVHRGQYYEDAKADDDDLWTHVTVIREVTVRFLLTAIRFKGRYHSYIGGYHDAEFPPTR
jgi:hypothetical protein